MTLLSSFIVATSVVAVLQLIRISAALDKIASTFGAEFELFASNPQEDQDGE